MNRDYIVEKAVELAKKLDDEKFVSMVQLQDFLENVYNKGVMDTLDHFGNNKDQDEDGFYGNRR